MSALLISIIGPPAVGKTTLADLLAGDLPADVIYEDFAGNPFLAASYTGQSISRLPAQMYYLISRLAQLRESTWPHAGTVVSDYGYCQDRIFASLRLSPDDLAQYCTLLLGQGADANVINNAIAHIAPAVQYVPADRVPEAFAAINQACGL